MEIDLRLPDLAAAPVEERGSRLVRHVIALWDGPDGAMLAPMLRACATHEAAADKARGIFAGQVLALLRGLGVSDAERRAALPPLAAMDTDAVAVSLGPTVQRYLHGSIA